MTNFWDRVDVCDPKDCWVWLGAKDGYGYGQIHRNKTTYKAHRLAWSFHFGENIPKMKVICHKCDNPACCNPDHLFVGTHSDNAKDKVSKNRHWRGGRPPHPCGERHPNSILTESAILDIRSNYTGRYGEKSAFAKKYGVDRSTIYRVIERLNWKEMSLSIQNRLRHRSRRIRLPN